MNESTDDIYNRDSNEIAVEGREAMERVSNYFATEQFLREDGSLNGSSIPDLLRDCDTVFSAGKEGGTEAEADVMQTLESLTRFFEYGLDMGEIAAANSIFGCVHANLTNICKCTKAYNEDNIRNLAVFLSYAVPSGIEDFSKEGWDFTNLLMDVFASDELRTQPYLNGKIYEDGDTPLSVDLLLKNLLNSESGDTRFVNLTTTMLARRYGFNQNKILGKGRSKRKAYARYTTSEAMNLFRIWDQCDGRSCLTLIKMGTTEDEDITRSPTPEEITMRRVQKVRRNFQVLEELKDVDSLKIARKLYRTNGIANFNRYSIATLSKQYEIQVNPYAKIPNNKKLHFLTLLPYSDYNGAFEGEHFVGNETSKEVHEVIIEAGSRREALVSILRSVKGTASRQHRNQDLYQIPFEYVYVAGHSDSEEIELGENRAKDGMLSSIINIQLVEDPELFNWLYRHMLIDDNTTVILGGCKTAEDKNHDPSWDNLAKTVMKKLGVFDVIAAKTSTYRDQTPVIRKDFHATLSPTRNRRKPSIVSIAQVLGRNLTYNQ